MGWIRRIFRKENPAYKSIFSTISSGTPIWTPKNYAALTEAGYQNCATVFACVSLIAKTASRIDWILTDRKDNEIEDHLLLDLLNRPNEFEGGVAFTEKVFSYLLLSGNSYITKVQGTKSGPARYLYTLRPDRMSVIPGSWDKPIAGYEYRAGANPVIFKFEDVLHLKEFHPLDDFYGMSRIEVAARDVDVSNQAKEWNKKLLQNDMRPSGVMNFENDLTEDQRAELRKQIQYRSSGYTNAGNFLITEGKASWAQMSITPKDVDWLNGQKFTMRQICAIFGVASELLGDSENKTYSNYQEARKALYEETILPLMDIYQSELNNWLVPIYGEGLELSYDRDSIEALQEDRSQKWTSLMGADWLTINEKREATGYDQITDGDVILVPISLVPMDQAIAEPEAPEEDPDSAPAENPKGEDEEEPQEDAEGAGSQAPEEDEGQDKKRARKRSQGHSRAKRRIIRAFKKSFWTDKGRRKDLWTQFDQRSRRREITFKKKAEAYLARQQRELKAKLSRIPDIQAIDPNTLVDVEREARIYLKDFFPWYVDHAIRAGEAGVRSTRGELFDDAEVKFEIKAGSKPPAWKFELTPQREEELIQMIFNSGTKVNESYIDIIYDTLHASMNDNQTIEGFTQQIWEQVDWMNPARARLWAETETTKVENWSTLEAYNENPDIEMKGWNCMMLDTSRQDHIDMDGIEIPKGDLFNVGGESMEAPGDPSGSAGNVCNCRCSLYPVLEKL